MQYPMQYPAHYFLLNHQDLEPFEIRYFDRPTIIQRGQYGADPSGVPIEWKHEELRIWLVDLVGEDIYTIKYGGFNLWDVWVIGDAAYVKMILYFPTAHRSTISEE